MEKAPNLTDNQMKAIQWGLEQIAKNNFQNSIFISKCENVTNVREFIEVQVDRIMFGCEAERKVSYARIKRLKDKLSINEKTI